MTTDPPPPSRGGIESPLSFGGWAVVVIAVLSGLTLPFVPDRHDADVSMWTFAPAHVPLYEPLFDDWNEDASATDRATASLEQVQIQSLRRRMIAGFLGDVPVADLLEVERAIVGPAFQGPVDDIGFVDLTERLESEGLRERFNPPSFSPWTVNGRVFGLPHDVHPVMLGYRADIVEDRFGIDVSEIETWDDFARITRVIRTDDDGDGRPDRYPLAIWPGPGHGDKIELLLLQAGGGFFDEQQRLVLASEANARVIATLVSWSLGDDRILADVPDFSASGNQQKLEGFAAFYFMPDWMCFLWREQLPGLAGNVKLMPMPAWEPGGRRTSVWGGAMLGISNASPRREEAWEFAKYLYMSDRAAVELYTDGDIITPVVEHWSNPVFDEPDPFFANQPKGRMYIDLAPDVPIRTSSPYNRAAFREAEGVVVRLFDYARANGLEREDQLIDRARTELEAAERRVRALMERNVFLSPDGASADADGGAP